MSYIEFQNVYKTYKMGSVEVTALSDCSFSIEKGELVVILGPSGAGKSTILNILGGMDKLSSGSVVVDNQVISKYDDNQLNEYRSNNVGFIFQFYNLMPNLTAEENVELAIQATKNDFDSQKALEMVGLAERKDSFPSQLSGGEQQRVAIARALGKNPKIMLCDEPTGALDYETGKKILSILQEYSFHHGMTTIIVTHNSALAKAANKIIYIKNGQVERIKVNKKPIPADKIEY